MSQDYGHEVGMIATCDFWSKRDKLVHFIEKEDGLEGTVKGMVKLLTGGAPTCSPDAVLWKKPTNTGVLVFGLRYEN